MDGWVESFHVEAEGGFVVMTIYDPSEGQRVPVRIRQEELLMMGHARPLDKDTTWTMPNQT